MRRVPPLLALLVVAFGLAALPRHLTSRVAVNPDFAHFESSHVHPVALTPDGDRLLVVNTPDNRLSVFDLTGPAPIRVAEIPVGLEPVSVVARSDGEAWVVNTLSDDVSIVDLGTLHTRATLRVGDEPSDVVFAGSPARAFVSVSAEDAIKVYDPANLASPPTVIPIPGRMPRALAPSADGSEVLVDVFNANGGTTVLSALEVGDSMPPPNPPMNPALPPPPPVALIVKQNAVGNWVDEAGHLWNSEDPVRGAPGRSRVPGRRDAHGEPHPHGHRHRQPRPRRQPDHGSGRGDRNRGAQPRALRRERARTHGRVAPRAGSRAGGAHTEVGLDPHIDYATTPGPPADGDSAIGLPTGVAWSPDGQRVYVSSLSTDRLGVLGANGALLARIPTVAGPTGVIADPERARLYVVGRFRNQLQTLSTADFSERRGRAHRLRSHARRDRERTEVLLRRLHLGPRRSELRELPPVRQHRSPRLGPRRSAGRVRSTQRPAALGLPSDEGTDGDPEPARAAEHRRAPLARRPRGSQRVQSGLRRADGAHPQLPDSEMSALEDFLLPLAYPPNPNQNLDRTFPRRSARAAQALSAGARSSPPRT